MLLGRRIVSGCAGWWSIAFLLICSTKFLTGSTLPEQETEELQESENDIQESGYDDQESEYDLQKYDDSFEIQPRSLTVLFTGFLLKFLGKKAYRWVKAHNQAGHQPTPQVAYSQPQYPPTAYPYPAPQKYPPVAYAQNHQYAATGVPIPTYYQQTPPKKSH